MAMKKRKTSREPQKVSDSFETQDAEIELSVFGDGGVPEAPSEWNEELCSIGFKSHRHNLRRFMFTWTHKGETTVFDVDYRRVFPTLARVIGYLRKAVHDNA